MNQPLQQQEQQESDAELQENAIAENLDTGRQETEQNADTDTDEKDLETVLSEFDEVAQAKAEVENPTNQNQQDSEAQGEEKAKVDNSRPDSRLDEMYAAHVQRARIDAERDVTQAIETMKSDSSALKPLPDYIIRGALDQLHNQDPRIGRAFALRNENPKLWKETVRELGKRIQRDFGSKPDNDASDDLAAVRASVRSQTGGSRNSGPSPEERASMSSAEWAEYKKKQYGSDDEW